MSIVQTNPAAFTTRFPIYTVADIDRSAGIVTLSGSDGSSVKVALNSWGNSPDTQPLVGRQVQILPDQA